MACPDGADQGGEALDTVRPADGSMAPADSDFRGRHPDRRLHPLVGGLRGPLPVRLEAWFLPESELLIIDVLGQPETEAILQSFEFGDEGGLTWSEATGGTDPAPVRDCPRPTTPSAFSSRKRLTARHVSSTSHICSWPMNTPGDTSMRRIRMARLRSGASVTDGNESMADMAAPCRADAGQLGGQDQQVGTLGQRRQRPVEHQGEVEGVGRVLVLGQPGDDVLERQEVPGSTSSARCRSSGLLHASSGCRSTSHVWRSE